MLINLCRWFVCRGPSPRGGGGGGFGGGGGGFGGGGGGFGGGGGKSNNLLVNFTYYNCYSRCKCK